MLRTNPRLSLLGATLALSGLLSACAQPGTATVTPQAMMASRAVALAAAMHMPDAGSFETHYLDWVDTAR